MGNVNCACVTGVQKDPRSIMVDLSQDETNCYNKSKSTKGKGDSERFVNTKSKYYLEQRKDGNNHYNNYY